MYNCADSHYAALSAFMLSYKEQERFSVIFSTNFCFSPSKMFFFCKITRSRLFVQMPKGAFCMVLNICRVVQI